MLSKSSVLNASLKPESNSKILELPKEHAQRKPQAVEVSHRA